VLSTEGHRHLWRTTSWKAPTWATETITTEAGLMYRPATCAPVEKLEGDAMPVTVELNGLDYLDVEDGTVTLRT